MLKLVVVEKNKAFEQDIKNVVGSFVKTEVDRLEKKVDSGFADIKSAIEDLKKVIASPPPPPAQPDSGGPEVQAAFRPTPNGGLSFAQAVGAQGSQPVFADVTTPNFNRKANPTKLFCNLHDRAKVSKKKFTAAVSVLAS